MSENPIDSAVKILRENRLRESLRIQDLEIKVKDLEDKIKQLTKTVNKYRDNAVIQQYHIVGGEIHMSDVRLYDSAITNCVIDKMDVDEEKMGWFTVKIK